METIPVSLIIASVFMPILCHAQPKGEPERGGDGRKKSEQRQFMHAWKLADQNRDGFISLEEFQAMRRIKNLPEEKRVRLFKRLDKNGDGKLGRQELFRMMRPPGTREERMQRLWELDKDRSGGVGFEEFIKGRFFAKLPPERQRELFKKLDTDGDGQITAKDRPEKPRPGDERLRRGSPHKRGENGPPPHGRGPERRPPPAEVE
jgi:Ca2+-binding EF-hand superfamily protein